MFKRVKSTESKMFFHHTGSDHVVAVGVDGEASVLELAIENKIALNHSCGGMGSCGTCRVFILHAPVALGERNEAESERATDLGFSDSERLACQTHAQPGMRVRIP